MRLRVWGRLFALAVFLLCGWYVVATYEWRALARVLAGVDTRTLVLGGGASILVFWLLRALRWQLLLKSVDVHVGFGTLYLCTALSLSLALVTPLMSGEALKVELLRRRGLIERMPGYSTFALERILDALIVSLMGIVGLPLIVAGESSADRAFLLLGLLILLAILGRVAVARVRVPGRLGEFLAHMRAALYSTRHFYSVFALTVAGWGAVTFGWMLCLHSIALPITYHDTMGVLGSLTLINVLSLVPGAVGVSEAGGAELLLRLGQTEPMAQAGALMFRIYELYILLLGALHFLLWTLLNRAQERPEQRTDGV